MRSLLAAVAAVVGLAACGTLPPPASSPDGAAVERQVVLELDGEARPGRWVAGPGEPQALVVLAHGYTRRCAHLRGTAARLATAGVASLCVDLPMAGGGAPALAEALAQRLLERTDPAGRPWPARLIVAGHSAGAVFALRLGQRLAEQAPQRLAGALLFDPVATADFGAALARVSAEGRRPVLALMAAPQRCNAQGNAWPALRQAQGLARTAGRDTLVLVDLGPGSTHADVEGEDSDWLAASACGRPAPPRVEELHERAAAWVAARLAATPEGPAGLGGPASASRPPTSVTRPLSLAHAARHATIPPCPTCAN